MIEQLLEQFDEIQLLLANAPFKTRMLILFSSIVIGIILSEVFFTKLRKIAAKMSNGSYPMVQRAFKGMPILWGILLGGYFAVNILTIPPRALAFLENILHSVGILSLTIMGARLLAGIITQKVQKTAGTFASTSILVTTIELIVYITGFLFLIQSFGFSITPLLTALGVGGLAVALALQDTLSNLFSGINILLSKQIRMGDFIKLSTGEEGVVVDMSWRNTTIKLTSDSMVVVPNQKIATSILTNFAMPHTECSIVVPVGVSYDSDLEQVEKVTSAVAKEILQEIKGGVGTFDPFIRYGSFADNRITFNVIMRVRAVTDQSLIQHEFIKRLHRRYQQEGIVIPYPDRTAKLPPSAPQGVPGQK